MTDADDDALRLRFLEILAERSAPDGAKMEDVRASAQRSGLAGSELMMKIDRLVEVAKFWALETRGRA